MFRRKKLKKVIEDKQLYIRYALAEKLNKTLTEIDSMTVEEFQGWLAYLEIKEERNGTT